MKTRLLLLSLLGAALGLAAVPVRAADAPPADEDRRQLVIVVVDTLQNQSSAITDFDRLDMAFQKVARQRKWPFKIKAERFAANTPDHETELHIVTQPLRRETPVDLTFRAWMTLTIEGKKHDLGIVTYRYHPRIGENMEDTLEKVFEGAAHTTALKIEPLLFSKFGAAP